jgi:hypothetical protein
MRIASKELIAVVAKDVCLLERQVQINRRLGFQPLGNDGLTDCGSMLVQWMVRYEHSESSEVRYFVSRVTFAPMPTVEIGCNTYYVCEVPNLKPGTDCIARRFPGKSWVEILSYHRSPDRLKWFAVSRKQDVDANRDFENRLRAAQAAADLELED